jgi:hypothetical protein
VEPFPDSGKILVSGFVSIELEHPAQSELVFDLHRTFSISSLFVNGDLVKYEFLEGEPTFIGPASRRVRVSLPPDNADQTIKMSISYGGEFPDYPEYGTSMDADFYLDDEISPQRVELSLYSAWYPSFGFGERYNSELTIRSLPENWKIACIGQEQQESESGFTCLGQGVNDLVIVASPDFKIESLDTPGGEVIVYHTDLPESFVVRESQTAGQALAFFSGVLGEPPPTYRVLKNVYSPRKLGQGGFARVGMTVFSEGRTLEQLAQNPLASILKGSAHESGHFWWNFGAGQGDWINESFAEYFALLAVKEINGDQAFASELVRCREAVKELPDDAPAISEVPFNNDGDGYTIRYQKGALMLDHLRQVLGDEAFYEASRGFYQKYKNQRIGTDEFRGFWKSALGEEKHWINTWLDSTGAMPVDTGLVN